MGIILSLIQKFVDAVKDDLKEASIGDSSGGATSGDQSHLELHQQVARNMPKWHKARLPLGVKFNRAEEVDDEDRLWLLHAATPDEYTLYAVNDGDINLHCTILAKNHRGDLKPLPGSTVAGAYLLGRWSAGVVSGVLKPGDAVAVATLPGSDAGRASVHGKWRREQKPMTGPGPELPPGLTIEGTDYNQGLFLVAASNGCRYVYNDTAIPLSAKILAQDLTPAVPELVGPGLERNSNYADCWDCGFVTPPIPPGQTIEAVQLTWPCYGHVLAKPAESGEYRMGAMAPTGAARWTFPMHRKSNLPQVVSSDRSKWPKTMQGPGPMTFAKTTSTPIAVSNGVSQQGGVTVRQEVGGKAWVVERKGYHPDFAGSQAPSGSRAPACSAAAMSAMTSLFVYNDTKDGEATFAFRFNKSSAPVAIARETAKSGDGFGGKMTGRVRAGETKFVVAFDPAKCEYEIEVECDGTPVAGTPMVELKPKPFAPKIHTSYLNNQGHVTRSH